MSMTQEETFRWLTERAQELEAENARLVAALRALVEVCVAHVDCDCDWCSALAAAKAALCDKPVLPDLPDQRGR